MRTGECTGTHSNKMKPTDAKKIDRRTQVLDGTGDMINVKNLCRLCMEQKSDMIKILPNNTIGYTMTFCLSINADVNRGMPDKVCKECAEVLNGFAQFRKKCKITDSKLRQIVRKNQIIQQAQQLYGPGFTHLETAEEGNEEIEFSPDTDFASGASSCLSVDSEDSRDDIGDVEVGSHSRQYHSRNAAASNIVEKGQEGLLCEAVVGSDLQDDSAKKHDSNDSNNVVHPHEGGDEYGEVETLLIEEEDLIPMENIKIEALDDNEDSEDNRATIEVQISLDGESYIVEVLGKTTTAGLGLTKTLSPSAKNKKRARKQRGYKLPVPEVLVVEDSNRERHLAFRCPECHKVYDNRILYRRHASSHIGATGVACKYCNKWFPIRSSLVRHERIHSGDKPYLCLLCNRSFTQKEILRRHVLTHSDSKPFKCKHCDKSYTQKEGLNAHIKNNHTVRRGQVLQYPCALCDKAFCHPSGLSRHLQSHTGKRFICKHCSVDFADSSSLRRHVVKLHPSEQSNESQSLPEDEGLQYKLLIDNLTL